MRRSLWRKNPSHGHWKRIRPLKDPYTIAFRRLAGLLQDYDEWNESEHKIALERCQGLPNGYTISWPSGKIWLEWVADKK